MSLYATDVNVENVVTTDPERAKALENDLRAKIVDMLADEEMTIEEIHDELEQRGEEKAETTVRHHVNVLKDAGIVELSRLEEAGGGTLKHYQSNTRVFSYELPDEAESLFGEMAPTVREELRDTVSTLVAEHGNEIEAIATEMKPCEFCSTEHYEEYILRELLNRTLTGLSEDGELDQLLD
jgi:DNA-binding transcriptional ArsR family regulator